MGTSTESLNSKLGLDTTDFKTGLAAANRELRVLESGFRASVSTLGDWANSVTGVEARQKSLTSQIEIQRLKVEALREEHDRLVTANGETSISAQNAETTLNKETERLGKMTVELDKTEPALANLRKGLDASGNSMQDMGKKVEKSGVSFKGLASSLLGPIIQFASLAGATRLVTGFIKGIINAATEAETAMTVLAATLRATGREAEISAGDIEKTAAALMKISTFDDEAIISAYNALARFESIPSDSMERIVKTAMDMTVVLGGDLASNAESIGKLLESGMIPRTWGWNAALKATVKSQIDAGDTAGALETVMVKLNSQFGGQAAAQLDTYAGKTKALNVAWQEYMEATGKGMIQAAEEGGLLGFVKDQLIKVTEAFGLLERARAAGLDVTHNSGLLMLNGTLVTQATLLKAVEAAELKNTIASEAATAQAKLEDGAFFRFNQTLADGVEDLKDYSGQLSSVSDLGAIFTQQVDDMDTALQNVKDAEQNLIDVRAANKWDTKGIKAATKKVEEAQQAVEDLKVEQQKQTDQWMLNCIQQALGTDGITSAEMAYLLKYQVDTGLITQEAAARAQAQWDSAMKMVDGFNQARDAANGITGALNAIPNITRYVEIVMNQVGGTMIPVPIPGYVPTTTPGASNPYTPGTPAWYAWENAHSSIGSQMGSEISQLASAMRSMIANFDVSVNGRVPAGAGAAAGAASVKVPVTVYVQGNQIANDVDITKLAYRVAREIQRRR